MNKRPMAHLLLFLNGMTAPKTLAWVMAVIVLVTATITLAAPAWMALIYNKAQNAVLMRMTPVSGATNYKIMRSETPGEGYQEIGTSKVPMFKDDAIELGSTYYYVFLAVTSGGEEQSDEKSVTIPGQKKLKLPAPTWKQAKASIISKMGKQSITVGLVWSQIRANEVIGYNIFRSNTSGGGYEMITSTGPGEMAFVDENVAVGNTYYYVLSALDNNLEETPFSDEKTVEVKAEEKKETKRLKRLRKPIPRLTEIVWQTSDDNPKTVAAGVEQRAPMANLADIVVDEKRGRVYASSKRHGHIAVLNLDDGKLVTTISKKGSDAGDLDTSAGFCVDNNGDLYIVDRGTREVKVFTPAGEFKRAYAISQAADTKPLGLFDVTISGDRLFIIDQANVKIIVLDKTTGEEVSRWGKIGLEDGQIAGLNHIKTRKDGSLVLTNGSRNRVDVFSPDGEFQFAVGFSGTSVDAMQMTSGFDVDDENNTFYITDVSSGLVKQYDPNGTPRQYQADMSNEDGTGKLAVTAPVVVEVVGDMLYVAEGILDRVTAVRMKEIVREEE